MQTDQNIDTPLPVSNAFCPSMYSTSCISDFAHAEDCGAKPQRTLHCSKTGRKTWKSLKEKKEAVWPDYLENALLEALERYRPTSSKDPRALRRFPKRNAYISNYIKLKTNVLRTPKQVGSRLQQLRETCTEERVIRLIVSRDFDAPDRVAAASAPLPLTMARKSVPDLRVDTSMPNYSPRSSNTASSAALTASLSVDSLPLDPSDYPETPLSDDCERRSVHSSPSDTEPWPHTYVHVDLNASDVYGRSLEATFTLDLDESGLSDCPVSNGPQRRISVASPVPIAYHTPSVIFSSSVLSPTANYESLFRVERDGTPLLEEYTRLDVISEPHCRPALFRASILPEYWNTLATNATDLNRYMIIQDIYESAVPADRRVDPIYTVVFNFDPLAPSLAHDHVNQPVRRHAGGTPADTVSSSQNSYFSSPAYNSTSPSDDARIPLAPIVLNTAAQTGFPGASPTELLNYDAVGEYTSLLPSISSHDSSSMSWYPPGGYFQSTGHFFSPHGVFNGLQSGIDPDGIVYPNLYPF